MRKSDKTLEKTDANEEVCDITAVLKAARFAAEKHRNQQRKGKDRTPYINHPLEVAEMIAVVGKITDTNLIIAALLHDTIEDTETKPEEIFQLFGNDVVSLVKELTDDKTLPKHIRKQRQIDNAATITSRAKILKLADKICNVSSISTNPPNNWSHERLIEYLEWSEKVVNELLGVNNELEVKFKQEMHKTRAHLLKQKINKIPE